MIKKEELEVLINQGFNFMKCCEILNISSRKLKEYIKIYGFSIDRVMKVFKDKCYRCDNIVEYRHTKKKDKTYCSKSCANKRDHNQETKDKISTSLKKDKIIRYCKYCNADITNKRLKIKHCSLSCSMKSYTKTESGKKHYINIGRISASKTIKRSQNEILFFTKCEKYFNNVQNNINIFNGWDADIIIHDIKYAILWNGKWHYEYIRGDQSLSQIQNRDRIKLIEIEKYGYKSYVIKDMGRYSVKKVEEEFEIFLNFLKEN